MDLRSLEIFMEVAELRSFTRAGVRLGYSQPTVSFQIKQLEQELGCKLFDRIGHTVILTEAGQEALTYAQRICRDVRQMTLGAEASQMPSGEVRVGMADSLCGPLIAQGFARFRKQYPGVSMKILTGGTAALVQQLDHNEVDLLCILDRHIYDRTYVIAAEKRIDVHFVAAVDSPLAQKAEVELGDLVWEPLLLTEKDVSYGKLLDEELAKRELEIHPVLELSRTDQLCGLVEKGAGISFLPDYVTQSAVEAGRIVRLEVPELQVELWQQLLYRRDKWLSLGMEAMIGHLQRMFQEY